MCFTKFWCLGNLISKHQKGGIYGEGLGYVFQMVCFLFLKPPTTEQKETVDLGGSFEFFQNIANLSLGQSPCDSVSPTAPHLPLLWHQGSSSTQLLEGTHSVTED